VGDLIRCLQIRAVSLGAEGANLSQRGDAFFFDRAATLLQQLSAPAVLPVAVSERLPESGDLDANGRCWVYQNGNSTTHWLPAHSIPLPQAGEVEA
jgi:hypothetical protein